jgi:Fe-S-cluster-containing dehydrogenase component
MELPTMNQDDHADAVMDPEDAINRRSLLKAGMGTMAALAATAGVLEPLRALDDAPTMEQFLRQHYSRLTPEKLDEILARAEADVARDYGAEVDIKAPPPIPGVEFAYALNLTLCKGVRACVYACMKENNVPPDRPEMAYIRVHELNNDSLDLHTSDPHYTSETVPQPNKYYMPIQCHQCRQPPCTSACPIQATWTEPDGIVVIDYNWCIGCRYCMAACPYEARRFNWSKPAFEPEDLNPDMGYLSNRVRPKGVVEKCHFCLHRTRVGKNPACLEVCPTGARVFGNLLDPDGRIQHILRTKRVFILKADANTLPRFYYFFDN